MIKKSKTPSILSKAPELTIDELTALYVQFNEQMKAAKANADRYKALLVEFNGRLLTLPNGVKIESRSQLKAEFAKEKVTLAWLEQLIDEGFGGLVEVGFTDKEVVANPSADLSQLMKLIGYSVDIKEILAVKAA